MNSLVLEKFITLMALFVSILVPSLVQSRSEMALETLKHKSTFIATSRKCPQDSDRVKGTPLF